MAALTFDNLIPPPQSVAQGAQSDGDTMVPSGDGRMIPRIVITPQTAQVKPSQGTALTFDDLIPKTAPQATTPASAPSATSQMVTDFLNQGSAAGQRTTPVIAAQTPNLISDKVFVNDAGELQYKDPKTGQLVTTDQNKEVVLRDPADNTLKVYARTPSTNEGIFSSLGRLISMGIGSSAPETESALAIPKPSAAAPSIEDLKTAATAGYESPTVTGLEISAPSLQNAASHIASTLNEAGLDENVAPATFGILAKAQKAPQGAIVTGRNLESLRKTLGSAAASPDPTERLAATRAQGMLHDFLQNVPASSVLAGSPDEFANTIKTANANYSAAKTSEGLDARITKAELQAGSTHSGMNVENKLRQQATQILTNAKVQRGFQPDELEMLRRISQGTAPRNALRWFGNLLGGGGGLGMAVSSEIGEHALGPLGYLTGPLGFVLKALSNRLTISQANKLSEMIRQRSPLGQAIQNAAADWQKAHDALVQSPSYAKFSAFALASRNLANNLASSGINLSPMQIVRSIENPSDSSADVNQNEIPRVPAQ